MTLSHVSVSRLAAAAAFAFGSCAFAGTVGGSVAEINTLTSEAYVSSLTIVGANAATDQTIVTGRINDNHTQGWKLTVTSGNLGKLIRDGGGGAGREITYTNVKFTKTSGTLGTGLSGTLDGRTRNIVTGDGTAGTVIFNTGTQPGTVGTATSATIDYDFALKISWSADRSLLEGNYSDTITLSLATDS